MKASLFNYYVVRQNTDEALVFNTFTSALLRTKAQYIPAIRNIHLIPGKQLNSIPGWSHLEEALQRAGMMVHSGTDEIEVLRQYFHNVFQNSETLHITFAPTLSCNFRCTYCCLGSLPSSGQAIDREKAEKFVNFVEEKLEESGCKNLFVVWFGGEPMLEANRILALGQKLQKICDLKKVNFFSEMYTNGSLLTPLFVQKAGKFGLNTISVTIDGPRDYHDARRPYRTGRGSYDTILENLQRIIPVSHTVNLGVIIQKSTKVQELRKMIHEFNDRGWFDLDHRVKTCITKAVGWSYQEQLQDIPTHEEYGKIYIDLVRLALEDPILARALAAFVTGLPGPGAHYFLCHARKRWSYAIDPQGHIYGCTYLLGRKEHAEGSLLETHNDRQAAEKRKPWMEFDLSKKPLKGRRCGTCHLLPICYSRCSYPLMSPAEFKGETEYGCIFWRFILDEYLPLHVLHKQNSQKTAEESNHHRLISPSVVSAESHKE